MNRLFKSHKSNFKIILASYAATIALSGCNSASGANSSNSPSPQSSGSVLTIDSAGVIPVFGASPTSTVIYVHNNSAAAINGINYTLDNNSPSSISRQQDNLASIDASQCTAIAAGQNCALKITTPSLNAQQTQGSMLLKANYSLANKPNSFSQLINYALVDSTSMQTNDGVKFKSGATIYSYGNSIGYATLYLYGSGARQNYIISDISVNKPSLKFNMNLKQHTIIANSVQAIEVSSPIMSSSIDATITVQSVLVSTNSSHEINVTTHDTTNKSLSDAQFSNTTNVAVQPASAGAILTTGTLPLINTVNGTSASMLIQNSGNQDAVIGNISAETGISGISGCSNVTLASGDTCTINFNVTEAGGSANITIPYTGGSASSVAANVTWFNGVGAALVSVSIANNPLSFSATLGAIIALSSLSSMSISGDNIESETQNLTISNNGAADATLSGIGLVDNPGYLLANNGDCGASLAGGSSCTAQIKLGPVSSYLESSGVSNYVVNYAAAGQTPAGVESTSVAWNVAPDLPSINMVASVTGCASGDGITTTCMGNPTATGGSSSSIQVVLTFTNSSSVTAATTISLPESSSSLFTVPGYSLFSNSCTNGAAANNGSCTIIYGSFEFCVGKFKSLACPLLNKLVL